MVKFQVSLTTKVSDKTLEATANTRMIGPSQPETGHGCSTTGAGCNGCFKPFDPKLVP